MKKKLINLISLIILLSIILTISCKNTKKEKFTEKIVKDTLKLNKEYGINLDSFNMEIGEITPNLFIAQLFLNYQIPSKTISEIITKTKEVFDVRRIKRGNKFAVFTSKDSLRTVKYIVYEKTLDKYIVFDFRDTLNVYLGQKEVTTKMQTASGIITSSLWETLQDIDLNPLLANDLSEVYAWSIDFFGLQVNDKFKILYSQEFVDTLPLNYGKIQAALFEHYGKEIYAIPFLQDSIWSYYDQDGQSLRKAFLKAPLKYSHISSGYSNSRLHPILKIYRPHHGVDYSAPVGTPVHSIGDGVIIEATYNSGAGNWLKVKHNGVYTTGYMHLQKFADGIHLGSKVKQGEVIGYVGSTGLSTGPHLDFRVYQNDEPIDPLTIDAPPVEPIKPENLIEFNKIRDFIVNGFTKIEYPNTTETK